MIAPAAPLAQALTTDTLRAVLDSVFTKRAYQWEERPNPLTLLQRWWSALISWLSDMGARHPGSTRVLFWALLTVFILIFAHATWVMIRTMRRSAAPPNPAGPGVVKDVHSSEWYRREADRLARAACFVEAIESEFMALVLDLDARRLLRYHPSKTAFEYVQELRPASPAQDEFRLLARSLYGYAFARLPCGLAEFEAWRGHARVERYASTH